MPKSKILITGAAGGFGQLITRTLLANGHGVIATMRGAQGKNKNAAKDLSSLGAEIVELDVTSDSSVHDAIEGAFKKGGFDVLINNAAVGVIGLQEAFTVDDFKKLYDVNVFGLVRVTREVLPHFRKNGAGLVMNISSLLGRVALPFYGPYNSTKWAVEALSENYRAELSPFGVDVCIVEPGGFPTTFIDHIMRPGDPGRTRDYGDMADAPEMSLRGFTEALAAKPEQNPQLVADAVLKLVDMPKGVRPFRTTVDRLGMGDAITGYNQQLGQITEKIFDNYGIGHLLKVA